MGRPSSLPMKKLPPGIAIIPSGQAAAAGAEATGATEALGGGALDALAMGARAGVPPPFKKRIREPQPIADRAINPRPSKSPFLLGPSRDGGVVVACRTAPDTNGKPPFTATVGALANGGR